MSHQPPPSADEQAAERLQRLRRRLADTQYDLAVLCGNGLPPGHPAVEEALHDRQRLLAAITTPAPGAVA